MRIVILTIGSRGDVQPYVALGLGLQRAGHMVRIAAPDDFASFVCSYGLEFASLGGSSRDFMASGAGRSWMATGRDHFAFVRQLSDGFRHFGGRYLENCSAASQGAEAIIFTHLGFAGWSIAEKLGVPCVSAHYNPFSLTRVSPGMFSSWGLRPGGFLNRTFQGMAQQSMWRFSGPVVNRWRAETLGLPPISRAGPYSEIWRQRVPFLHGYSPAVLPRYADWPPWYHVTGYWFLDQPAGWQPPEELVRFLSAGPPPVLIGFGSTALWDPAALSAVTLEALERTGQRAVLLAGWAGIGQADLPKSVIRLDEAPHDWLFPRMAALVHHGGASTTAAGLRAGVPSIITPYFFDQPFWGERVAALGVGPKPVPLKGLSVERLAGAIRQVMEDGKMRDRAAALGERIRAEDGVTRAVEIFDAHLRAAA